MNRETVSTMGRSFSKIEALPFERLSNQSRLFIDFQNQSKSLRDFYPNRNSLSYAETALANYEGDREKLCDFLRRENIAYDAESKTLENIEALRDETCVAVITGQQAGLYGGPIYTIYKALTAVRYSAWLRENGVNAVPVFWIASEDHDFDEIKKTFVIDEEGDLRKIENSPAIKVESPPIGHIKVDSSIDVTNKELLDYLGKTQFTYQTSEIVNSCYNDSENFGSSFAKLLVKLLKDTGLIFVSPLNEGIRRISAPIVERAIESSEKIVASLLTRNTELQRAGYHSQVFVEKDFFPFFYIDDSGTRNALRFNEDQTKIVSVDSKFEFDIRELADLARETPEKLSPNALMRPIVQDYIFPTAKYFGGGAEIAYFAQNSIIYDVLDRPVTPIEHRASFTIIEPRHGRTLEKYELEFEELFAGEDEISARIVERYLNPETASIFDHVDGLINDELVRLKISLSKTDPTLSESLTKRKEKIVWHIGALRKKYHRVEIEKNAVIKRRLENLFEGALPRGVLQERTLNPLYFFNKYGENFVSWVYDAIDSEGKNHQILSL